MIYLKEEYTGDLLNEDVYRIAENNIEFVTKRKNIFAIEKNTLFTVSTSYLEDTDEYKVTVKGYKFSGKITRYSELSFTDSPLIAQDRVIEIITPDSYEIFLEELKKNSRSMDKTSFESAIEKNPAVLQYISEVEEILEKNRNMEKRIEEINNEFYQSELSLGEKTVKIFFDRVLAVTDRITENSFLNLLFNIVNILIGFISALILIPAIVLQINGPLILLTGLIAFFSISTLILGTAKANELYKNIFSFPFIVMGLLTGKKTKKSSILVTGLRNEKLIEINENNRLHIKARDDLNSKIGLIAYEIFESNKKVMTFSDKTTSEETETRSPEEITGGYERIKYPEYRSESNDKPENHERKVISLTKPGK